jgi:hypothetical protein
MTGKISVKKYLLFSLLYGIVLALCACMVPIDLPAFFEDPRVVNIVDSKQAKVIIDYDSDDFDNLIAGENKISGLDPDTYYLVEKEEKKEGGAAADYPKYVSDLNSPGRLEDYLGGITRISGGSINGLTNNNTYTVRTAKPFNGTVEYTQADGFHNESVNVTNGEVTIISIGSDTISLDLNLSDNYEIMAVSVDGEISKWKANYGEYQSMFGISDEFTIETVGTTIDYVMIKVNVDSSVIPHVSVPAIPIDFKVLKVEVVPGNEEVIIGPDSISGLTAGNEEISGLNPNEYYMVEKVVDKNNALVSGYPKFGYESGGNGGLGTLGQITRISGGKINGLTNYNTYTVRAAQQFPNSLGIITYTQTNGLSNEPIDIKTGGKITIEPQGIGDITLNLNGILTGTNSFDVMAVPAGTTTTTSWSGKRTINNSSWSSFDVDGDGTAVTTVDYVFVEVSSPGVPVVPANFKVLQVEVNKKTEVGIEITINFNSTDPGTLAMTTGTSPISYNALAAGNSTLVFTLSGGTFTNIVWELDGNLIPAGLITSGGYVLTINNSIPSFLTGLSRGTHVINLSYELSGIGYSAKIIFEAGP